MLDCFALILYRNISVGTAGFGPRGIFHWGLPGAGRNIEVPYYIRRRRKNMGFWRLDGLCQVIFVQIIFTHISHILVFGGPKHAFQQNVTEAGALSSALLHTHAHLARMRTTSGGQENRDTRVQW